MDDYEQVKYQAMLDQGWKMIEEYKEVLAMHGYGLLVETDATRLIVRKACALVAAELIQREELRENDDC